MHSFHFLPRTQSHLHLTLLITQPVQAPKKIHRPTATPQTRVVSRKQSHFHRGNFAGSLFTPRDSDRPHSKRRNPPPRLGCRNFSRTHAAFATFLRGRLSGGRVSRPRSRIPGANKWPSRGANLFDRDTSPSFICRFLSRDCSKQPLKEEHPAPRGR